ncbi:MAG TPA: hypothetical protein VI915_04340 [Thermoplasmata archaeon]|nr:hypothetical protein [Thermoplasmata archaeon]
MTTVSFHFHGYQPGDVVRWLEPDPLKPQLFEERRSPVALTIGAERVAGRNWTDAVLRTYGRMERVLEKAAGAASVDVEPQTLAWLLERDPDAYQRVVGAWRRGTAGLVMTPPFHPILPHHHRIEREALFEMMIDFYAPVLRRHDGPIGLWLPEAAYSGETLASYVDAARRATVHHEGLPDLVHGVHLLLDARQLAAAGESMTAWGKTGINGGLRFAARDVSLSGEFAFGGSEAAEFVGSIQARHASSLLVASDLESLLANPAQADRFERIVEGLRMAGIDAKGPSPPPRPMAADVLDYSSWSDYDEHLLHGHTSDSRWTGLRRSDGAVLSRVHRGERLSQLWKHAFTLATEGVESAVRRTARGILKGLDVQRRPAALRRLAVAYGRHLFQAHYRACGLRSSDVDFARAAETILRGRVDVELAGRIARGYAMMLMGLRSDPRFWDNPDTRVMFQGVACLAQALVDMADACARAGDPDRGTRLLRLLKASLLEFSEAYARGGFADLQGTEGWETTEAAWLQSLESEVPGRSAHDVVRRAVLYSTGNAIAAGLPEEAADPERVADTGHIAGEAHGDWGNREWCEHRAASADRDRVRG